MDTTVAKTPTSTVFVGNVPFGVTEEQLVQIFEQCGPVKSFRIVTDRESGKPKGYGFCAYHDVLTACSAQRNLNGYEINNRVLRVDFAEDNLKGERGTIRELQPGLPRPKEEENPQVVGLVAAATAAQTIAASEPGMQQPGTPGSQDTISLLLAQKSRPDLFQILSQMKILLQQNPHQARQVLVQNPQLARALLQAQILLGMVRMPNSAAFAHADPNLRLPPGSSDVAYAAQGERLEPVSAMTQPSLQHVRASHPPPATAAQALHVQHAVNVSQGPPVPLGPAPASYQMGPVDPRLAGTVQDSQNGAKGSVTLPAGPQHSTPLAYPIESTAPLPVTGKGHQYRPPGVEVLDAAHHQQVPYTAGQAPHELPSQSQRRHADVATLTATDQQKLVEQVMSLTPSQIDQLPPEQRNAIIAIKVHMQQQMSTQA